MKRFLVWIAGKFVSFATDGPKSRVFGLLNRSAQECGVWQRMFG